ncbi:MAG: nicotinate-nucleotide adenylyltransferase [Clostridia bacterium]|nr:nicotinate-nucleotide adenylyltransferase [Clostridia bacterium]
MSKIGIMGGTFDPIHFGHLKIASCAKSEYHLDKVIFLTSGNPPHKRDKDILDAKIRHIMVKLAISGIDGFFASDYEVNRAEYSYSANTLKHFHKIMPDDELFFIIGGDSLRDFHKWYKPDEILKLCTLLVYDRKGGEHTSDFSKPIQGATIDISSTVIREKLEVGEDVSEFVPPAVLEFIKRNNIYRKKSEPKEQLKTLLTPERYAHSIGVMETAVELAKIHGADLEKARIAGLLHDNAKNLDNLYERAKDLEADLDEFEMNSPPLVHAKLGAETAKIEFGITDPEILDAIKWHTIGRPNMTLLEKIIFVADLTEPGRDFPDAGALRALSRKDLDKAVAECIKSTIEVNKKRDNAIHPNAFLILEKLNEKA